MSFLSSGHKRERLLLTILLLVIGVVLTISNGLKRWDMTLYDLFSTFHYQHPADDVLILAIDELSLREFGRWPWPRTIHARLIDKLRRGGARAVGYDVIFSEPSRDNPENDQALARAVRKNGRVILPVFHEQEQGGGPLHLVFPLPELVKSAAGLGHVDVRLDPDGVVRKALLSSGNAGQVYPALVVAMLQLNESGWRERAEQRYGNEPVYVSFTGPPGHFASISVADFLQKDYPAKALRDKLVLVGVTALGLGDTVPTPVSVTSIPMPGVEFNANLLSGLLNQTLIRRAPMSWRIGAVVVLALLPLFFYPLLNPRQSLTTALSLFLAVPLVALFLLHAGHIWFPPSALLLVLALSYPLWAWRKLEETIVLLFREKERARVILNSIGDGVIAMDTKSQVEYMNPVAEIMTGFALTEARNRQIAEIFSIQGKDGSRQLDNLIENCLKEKRIVTMRESAFVLNRKQKEYVVRVSAGILHKKSGLPQGVALSITDITRTHRMMEQMTYQATHDLLTGLPNRTLFYERMTEILRRRERNGDLAALVYLDLDQFKKVNDQLGHYGADRLLKRVGKRLLSCCGEKDVLAHFGSDKFVIGLNRVRDRNTVAHFAEKIQGVLAAPFTIQGQDIYISCTMGICLFPGDGADVDELLKNSDTAMYRAKERGRGLFRFFSKSMNDRIRERLRIEQELRDAIARDELRIYYQPQVRAKDGRLIGAESLLRWENRKYGSISPSRFIPVAEECGLILPIGEWALRQVCTQLRAWREMNLPLIRVAVNLSSRQFLYGNIYAIVRGLLEESEFDPVFLELEITESMIMEDQEQAIELLGRLKKLGVRISIDDFGTGYSSLSYLKHFPVDQLKIDQSFVRDIVHKPGDAAITKAIVTMGHGLGLGVIAEGVEDEEQLAILRGQECDEIQGYLFSRPLSADQMTAYILSHAKR